MSLNIFKRLLFVTLLMFLFINNAAQGQNGLNVEKSAGSGVVFSEVLYDSWVSGEAVGEWIELYNTKSSAVAIGGWTIEDIDRTYNIPGGTTIGPGCYLIISDGQSAFYQRYGCNPHLSNMSLQLNNSGGYLILRNSQDTIIDQVAWESGGSSISGWGSTTNPYANDGKSIVRSDLNQDTDTYADWLNNQTPNPNCNGTPQISLSPTQLNFELNAGETDSQSFSISNSGCGTLNWTVTDNKSWISCSPTSGTNSSVVTVTVNTNGLSSGTYTGTVTVTDPNASNSPGTVTVSLTVNDTPVIPQISLSTTQLNFEVNPGETASQYFSISNSGGGTLNWTVTDNKDWIECNPTSGTNSGEVKVTVDSKGLPPGTTHTGTVTVADPNASNSPRTVTVTLIVNDSGDGILKIHYINVQQGQSILIVGPDGTIILLDGGAGGKGTGEVIPYLQSQQINTSRELDYIIATHLDTDHYRGLTEVMNYGYDALNVYYNGSDKSSSSIDDFKAAAGSTTAGGVTPMPMGHVINMGGASATCVAVNGSVIGTGAVPGGTNNENDRSIGLLIQYGGFDYLVTGDMGGGDDDNWCTGRSTGQVNLETPLAEAIMPGGANPLLSSYGLEVLHVAHHGSESSTNSDFMNQLTPRVSCISVGSGQGYNYHHPRKDVVENVLLAQASCITAPASLVLQTEEGSPTGDNTSYAGYCAGDIVITTSGVSTYSIGASGAVSQGPDERDDAGLPVTYYFDGESDDPLISLNPTRLDFELSQGETASQYFSIGNSGGGTLNWTVTDNRSWITCDPLSGTNSGQVKVTVSSNGLPPGTYTGTVTVADPNASNSPRTVNITMEIIDHQGPRINLSVTQLNFEVNCGETDSQDFSISNSGGGTLNWTVSDDKDWIECSPTSGTDSDVVTVTVNTNDLSPGTYTGTVTVADPNASNSPRTVNVTLIVNNAPLINLDPTQLNFEVNPGESASQNFLIGNSGCGTLNWTVTDNKNWITCDPTSGTNSGQVEVTVDSDLLSPGTYTGTVTVTDPNADNSPGTVNVTLIVGIPEIALSRTGLYFGASGGVQTGTQSFFVSNSGSGRLNWAVTDNADWLDCSPASGTDSGVINVSVNSSGLAPGMFTGTVYVSDPNATNSPQALPVTLKVYMTGFTSNPFGTFETPITGSTVRSSIPVTGWVVDDIEVASVKIYRGEAGNLAYVGDAVFVEGARPDVEQSWPDWPKSYQAGWGYMLLTHFLSIEGDGTYTLYAKATDAEGHQVTLGSKTITVDNANAVKPFGAIDTPTQGGSASGSGFINWGWALTPQPNCIPTDGSTITVYVDGIAVGNPIYNIYRDDIHQRFPNCLNSSGAMGRFTLDTTVYTNGVHTIAWSVTDDGGNSDGIGSRYFSVVNTGAGRTAVENRYIGHSNSRRWTRLSHLADIPVQTVTSLEYFRGYDRNREPEMANPDEYGVLNVQCRELERLEIRLAPPGGNLTGATYTGYHAVGSQLKSLPIGSYLDPHTGVFCWQPGTGFVGTYRLMFIRADGYGGGSRLDVVVTIAPRFR